MTRAGPANPRSIEDILSSSLEFALAGIGPVAARDLMKPTPCVEWRVGDVLYHLADSLSAITSALNFGTVPHQLSPASAREGALGRTVLTPIFEALDAAARRSPARRTAYVRGEPIYRDQLLVVASLEAAIHTWDAAVGAGIHLELPDPLAARLHTELSFVLEGSMRQGLFAAPVGATDGATEGERLLAALGRQPRWSPSSAA